MLVLSRQRDEVITIGDDIEITVVDIRGDKVRLGISAPRALGVHRKEVYVAIEQEKRAKAGAGEGPAAAAAAAPTAPAPVSSTAVAEPTSG